jgi:hypothetical protein
LLHGSLGFRDDLLSRLLALEVFRVNDYALFIVGRMLICCEAIPGRPRATRGRLRKRKIKHVKPVAVVATV